MDLNGYLEFTSLSEPVPLRAIVFPRIQVREDSVDLAELVESIRSVGLIHPILLRPISGEKFEIVAGMRRFSACKILHWAQIPAVIREMSSQEAFEVGLAENVQRKSMNPIEEARAFQRYVEHSGWGSITSLATKIGKSKSYVSQRLFLLSLPETIQSKLQSGEISPCIARQLAGVAGPSLQEEVVRKVNDLKLSTRSSASLIRSLNKELQQGEQDPSSENSLSDFEPRPEKYSMKRKKCQSTRTIQQTILALRLAMARLDILREKCEDEHTAKYVLDLRLELHGMIDACIRRKTELQRFAEGEEVANYVASVRVR